MTDPAALSTHAILGRAARGDGATRVVILDPHFQGLPDAAHGGTILALFDSVASANGPRTIAGAYRRRVPLATPLQLAIDRAAHETRCSLSDGATLLVDGVVNTGNAPPPRATQAPYPFRRPASRAASTIPSGFVPVSRSMIGASAGDGCRTRPSG